jgi:hypothetical protein
VTALQRVEERFTDVLRAEAADRVCRGHVQGDIPDRVLQVLRPDRVAGDRDHPSGEVIVPRAFLGSVARVEHERAAGGDAEGEVARPGRALVHEHRERGSGHFARGQDGAAAHAEERANARPPPRAREERPLLHVERGVPQHEPGQTLEREHESPAGPAVAADLEDSFPQASLEIERFHGPLYFFHRIAWPGHSVMIFSSLGRWSSSSSA